MRSKTQFDIPGHVDRRARGMLKKHIESEYAAIGERIEAEILRMREVAGTIPERIEALRRLQQDLDVCFEVEFAAAKADLKRSKHVQKTI